MNCQSRLVRLFLSSCCDDEFKTADKVECIGFLLRAVKGLYSAEPSNSCSILSDNSWDLIRSEKWNELWLGIRISTLIPDKNHQAAAAGFILFQVTSLLASTGAELLRAELTFLAHPRVKSEGQLDGLPTCERVILLPLKRCIERANLDHLLSCSDFFLLYMGYPLLLVVE